MSHPDATEILVVNEVDGTTEVLADDHEADDAALAVDVDDVARTAAVDTEPAEA